MPTEDFEDSPLLTVLLVAVPLRMMRLAEKGGPSQADFDGARKLSQVIAEHGDNLLFRGVKGESADVFNAVAEGMAVLSFCPGGLRLFGHLWCGNHLVFGAKSQSQVCPQCAEEVSVGTGDAERVAEGD